MEHEEKLERWWKMKGFIVEYYDAIHLVVGLFVSC